MEEEIPFTVGKLMRHSHRDRKRIRENQGMDEELEAGEVSDEKIKITIKIRKK